MLDRRRLVNQKIWAERMEDEGVEYRKTNGVGEIEHTGG